MSESKLPAYSEDQIKAKLSTSGLAEWKLEDGWLRRKFTTEGWPITLMAVNAIGFICEAADHHADLAVSWGKLWVKLQTHSSGGVTDKDFELARKIEDELLWRPKGGALKGTTGKFVSGH